MSWRDDVVAEAKTWRKTPYHSGARVKNAGVDCGQLLIGVYENAGVIPIGDCNPGSYSPEWHLHHNEELYLQWVQKYCDITTEQLPGNIAVFQFGRCVSHAGIILEWPFIIHSYVGIGVTISSVHDALLLYNSGKSRLRGIYTPKVVGD